MSAFIFSGVDHQKCFAIIDNISSTFLKSPSHSFLESSHTLHFYSFHKFESFDYANMHSKHLTFLLVFYSIL